MSDPTFLALAPWVPAGAALLVLAVLCTLLWSVLQRVRLLEQRLRETLRAADLDAHLGPVHESLARLAPLAEQVAEQARRLDALPPAATPAEVEALRQDLADLRQPLGELEHKLETVLRQVLRLSDAPGVEEESWRDRVRRALEAEGFVHVRLMRDDEPEEEADQRFRVPVEARRRGVSYKGAVTVAAGRVVDVALTPAYEAFP